MQGGTKFLLGFAGLFSVRVINDMYWDSKRRKIEELEGKKQLQKNMFEKASQRTKKIIQKQDRRTQATPFVYEYQTPYHILSSEKFYIYPKKLKAKYPDFDKPDEKYNKDYVTAWEYERAFLIANGFAIKSDKNKIVLNKDLKIKPDAPLSVELKENYRSPLPLQKALVYDAYTERVLFKGCCIQHAYEFRKRFEDELLLKGEDIKDRFNIIIDGKYLK